MVRELPAQLGDTQQAAVTVGEEAAVVALSVEIGLSSSDVAEYAADNGFADILDWLLPILYLTVFGLGVAMLVGRNPFERLITTEAPVLRSPTASAYLYGMFLAPMTLPCTGPLIVSAFPIGGVSGGDALADSLTYFVFFALGFGWPLVRLPLLAAPVQRRATRFLTRHHRAIGTVSGVLLIFIAILGYWTEVRPSRS